MKAQATREKILQASISLISRFGYDAVTIRQISKEVGIQASSLYNHFDSKEAILDGIMDFLCGYLKVYAPTVQDLERQLQALTPAQVLTRYVTYYADHADPTWLALYRILYMGMYRDPRFCDAAYRIIISEPVNSLLHALELLTDKGLIPPGDHRSLAELWVRTALVYGYQAAHDYEKVDWQSYYAVNEFFIKAALRGVRAIPLEQLDLHWEGELQPFYEPFEATSTGNLILHRALDLFSEYGFANVSIREIAKEVGIRPGSIYNHFSSKEDIMKALISHFLVGYEQYTTANPAFQAILDTKDPHKIILSFSSSYPPVEKDSQMAYKVYKVLFREQYLNDDLQRFFTDSIHKDTQTISQLLNDLIVRQSLPPCDAKAISTAYVHTMCTLTIGATVDHPFNEEPLRLRCIAYLVGLVFHGYTNTAPL